MSYTLPTTTTTTGKARYQPPNPSDPYLICTSCINKRLMSNNNNNNNHNTSSYSPQESIFDVQRRSNLLYQSQIHSKIQNRIRLSESLSKHPSFISPSPKDQLINTNEHSSYFDTSFNNDLPRQRALNKYNALHNSYPHTYNHSKVDAYYKVYVDNYQQPNPYGTYKSVRDVNYLNDLQKQIKDHEKMKRFEKESEMMLKDFIMKDNEMYLHKIKEEERKRKDRNEMIIKDNLQLMRLKKEGDVNAKRKDVERERLCLEKEKVMYNEEYEKKKYREYMKQMEMKKGLIQQIEEHEYNKKKAKEYNNNTYSNYSYSDNIIQDNCNKGNCTCCNNKYPINLLNYRKQYEFLDNTTNTNNNN